MRLTPGELEQQLAELEQAVPRLLQDNPATEFWIEFLERANAIRDHVALDHYEWVTERIYEALARYGISPPSRWIIAAAVASAERIQDPPLPADTFSEAPAEGNLGIAS